jgi:enoyl-CoA hydratase/methylglutaconyl-CoA hydratase
VIRQDARMSEQPQVQVTYAVSDGVATITLDSPHNRNALSRALVGGLFEALERAAEDDSARVVVVAATGSVFCSGADLSEAASGSMEQGALEIVRLQRVILLHPKPVVCRLQGPVRAGGTGIAPAAISLTVFPRMTSRGAALRALGGEVFTAAQAQADGLVTEVVPAEELDESVDRVTSSLATGALQGLRETKKLLNAPLVEHLDAHGRDVAALSARLFGSEEAKEAMTAFLSRKR